MQTVPQADRHLEAWDEGCLSLPGAYAELARPDLAICRGQDQYGQPTELTGTGQLARCFQHETDHLDGHLYLDRLLGRHRRAARRMLKARGWTDAGHSWLPGQDRDPFGH